MGAQWHKEGWTAARVARMVKMREAGHGAGEIATALGGGVTRNAVIGKLSRMGLSRREVPAQPRTVAQPRASAPNAKPRPAPARSRPVVVASSVAGSPPPAVRAVASPPAASLNLSLLELGPGQCKWPTGGGGIEPITFCANRLSGHHAYCASHAAVGVAPRASGVRRSSDDLARRLRRFI